MFWQKKNKPPEFTGGFQDKNLIKKKINIVVTMTQQKHLYYLQEIYIYYTILTIKKSMFWQKIIR